MTLLTDRIVIKDGSDGKDGLKVGQQIKVNGRGNLWTVTKRHPDLIEGERIYDVQQVLNRKARRATRRKK